MNKRNFIPSLILLAVLLFSASFSFAQTPVAPVALPIKTFLMMRDSTNSVDVVILQGKGGSTNFEGRNVKYFNSFISSKTAAKTNAPLGGTIMWLIDGKEFLFGNYFLGDSTGYVVIQKDGKEYVNQLNQKGNSFLKSEIGN